MPIVGQNILRADCTDVASGGRVALNGFASCYGIRGTLDFSKFSRLVLGPCARI